jgi:hypothetical protein
VLREYRDARPQFHLLISPNLGEQTPPVRILCGFLVRRDAKRPMAWRFGVRPRHYTSSYTLANPRNQPSPEMPSGIFSEWLESSGFVRNLETEGGLIRTALNGRFGHVRTQFAQRFVNAPRRIDGHASIGLRVVRSEKNGQRNDIATLPLPRAKSARIGGALLMGGAGLS